MKRWVLVCLALLCLWPMTAQAEEQEEQPQQTQEQSEEEFETELQNTINGLDLSDLQQGWEEDEMAQHPPSKC